MYIVLWAETSPSNALTFDQVIARLSKQDVVDGVIIIGSACEDNLTPASDYDLVLVLSEMPVQIQVGLTYIDGHLADLIFLSVAQIDQVLELDASIDGDTWLGRIVRWFLAGRIAFDRSGKLRKAQKKVQSGEWLQEMNKHGGYGAWFKINYNLSQTKRLLSSSDPTYLKTADLRMALYGPSDLVFGYWELHRLRWEGDKAAIRYLSNHDPDFLNLLQQFLVETKREIKFDLYERLAASATVPMGGIWPDGATALTFDLESVTPEIIERGLRFVEELVFD